MNRLDRALGILLYLRGGQRCAARDLAARFEVSTRTIYRDLDLLSALGVPIYAERGRGGGIRLMPGYFLPPVTFTTGEAVSVILAITLLHGLQSRPFAAEIETAQRKLLAAVPSELRDLMADAARLVAFETPPVTAFHLEPSDRHVADPAEHAAEAGETVTCFLRALLDRRAVCLRYRSPYRATTREAELRPLGLLWDRNLWYLIGTGITGAPAPRQWRADRVLAIAPGAPLTGPEPPFDVRTLLGRAWLDAAMADWIAESPVRLRLTPLQVARLRHDWYYGRARFEAAADGAVIMTYGEDNPAAVFSLLRWLGPGATLIEPVAWRAAFRRELAEMLAEHDGSPV